MTDDCYISKIEIMFLASLIISFILTSANIISNEDENKSIVQPNLFIVGILVNVILIIFAFYLGYHTYFDSENNILITYKKYIIYIIFLICTIYLIVYGVTTINSSNDPKHEKEITNIAIASTIGGIIGILYIIMNLLFC